jgi:hypothetical protein
VPVFGRFTPDGMKLNMFPVTVTEKALSPWNIHRVNLSRLPVLDIKVIKADTWLNTHVCSMMSSRERSLKKKNEKDVLMFVKDTLLTIFAVSSGMKGGPVRRLFALRDKPTTECDTFFFISGLRFDLQSHGMVCDGYVFPLTPMLVQSIGSPFNELVRNGNIYNIGVYEGEMKAWKQLLPALVERCRTSWKHGKNCEYESQGKVPLTEVMHEDPLCSCGRGKETEGLSNVGLWSKFAPYVTRVALSPLFAVSYLETVIRNPAARRCFACRGQGKPNLMKCAVCKKVRYCSRACQKRDWKVHKILCKP